MEWMKRIVASFAGGSLGALANSLAVWGFGALGVSQALGFMMAPPLTLGFLLPRLFFGALWGALFLAPFWGERWLRKGLVVSVAPSLYMLFVVFPNMEKGLLGLDAGVTAPLFVLFFNAIWGVVAAGFLRWSTGKA